MKIFLSLMIVGVCLSACQTLDYAKGRGEVIRDRESRQAGQRIGGG